MSLQIEYQPNDICVLRISGTLKRSEFAVEQSAISQKIDAGSKPHVLAILEDFGWSSARASEIFSAQRTRHCASVAGRIKIH